MVNFAPFYTKSAEFMAYHFVKIAHIVSAAFVLMSMIYSFHIWRTRTLEGKQIIASQAWVVIAPFAFLQLLTGFTMISLQQEEITQLWIKGSIVGFMLAISSWFGFIYFYLSSGTKHRYWQKSLLFITATSILSIIFFMASKV